MKYLPFVWKSLWRSPARTGFTLASIMVAFTLYALLQTVNGAFNRGATLVGTHRLITSSLYTITESLPLAYKDRIRSIEGVRELSTSTWFGASYRDKKNRFAMFAVDHTQHFKVLKELTLPADQQAAWADTRNGVVLGAGLAERLAVKIGDTLPVDSDIWGQKSGSYNWPLKVVGIYHAADPANDSRSSTGYLRQDYFDEARAYQSGTVSLFLYNTSEKADVARIANAIDALFANSPNETKSQTEAAFSQQFAKQLGDIGIIITGILGAVFFTLVILTGNTLMQSVRERIPELAVLKTLGFSNLSVMNLVLAECLFLCSLGALLGVALGFVATAALRGPLKAFFPVFVMPPATWLNALGIAAVIAAMVGFPPAYRALRVSIVEALRS